MKKTQSKKSATKVDTKLVNELSKTLKIDTSNVLKLATLERKLLTLKSEKKAKEQKSVRASMRNLTFYRHEVSAENLAKLQKIASQIQ